MNRLLVILIFFIGFKPCANGQSRDRYLTIIALADSVNIAFRANDTAKGIAIFNKIEKLYLDSCRGLYHLNTILADASAAISQVYLKESKFDSSLHYLNLADDEFLPYKNCGNGGFVTDVDSDSSLRRVEAVYFMEKLTRLYSESDANDIGKLNPAKKDYNKWNEWFKQNKSKLQWSKRRKRILSR